MSISGHKYVESLKIYMKVSVIEKFKIGFTLGYVIVVWRYTSTPWEAWTWQITSPTTPRAKAKKEKHFCGCINVNTKQRESTGVSCTTSTSDEFSTDCAICSATECSPNSKFPKIKLPLWPTQQTPRSMYRKMFQKCQVSTTVQLTLLTLTYCQSKVYYS